jgi:hypothetical protein
MSRKWGKLEADALWRDLVFQGFAYVPNEELVSALGSLSRPLVAECGGGSYTRLTLPKEDTCPK